MKGRCNRFVNTDRITNCYMKKILSLLLVIAVIWFAFFRNDHVSFGPGVLAPDSPEQTKILFPEKFQFKDYTITPLAKFHIEAKVLSQHKYSWGREAELSPVDLALGWGKMSDESVLAAITITQSNRWYHWHTDKFPIPRREIETHSGNMHIIPADEYVRSKVGRVRTGDIVELRGYLVRVDAKDGWHWVSSLSRDDTGDHSCELIYTEDFEIQKE